MEKLSKYILILIEDHRKDKNLTQENIAELVGLSKRYYQYLIINRSSPGFDLLYEMCESLGLRLSELINEAEQLKIIINKSDIA